jgi:DNA-binding transcriptional ArsR family regulator
MERELHALAEPNRRDILKLILDREQTVSEIASHFQLSRPAISQHLRVLLDAGLVSERREGTKHYYSAEAESFDALIVSLREFWSEGLKGLKKTAEAEERNKKN